MPTTVRIFRIPGSPSAGASLPKLQFYGFRDTFTRPDASVLGTTEDRKPWQIIAASVGAVWGVESGQAKCISVNSPSTTAMAVADALTADGVITYVIGTAAGDSSGAAFRAKDISNYFWLANSSNRITLWKRVAGLATQLAQGPTSAPFLPGDTLTITLAGSSIVVRRNGAQVIAVTETDLSDATKHGFFANSASVAVRWDSITHTVS